MAAISLKALLALAFRDYATDGVPGSGVQQIVKSDVRTALAVADALASLSVVSMTLTAQPGSPVAGAAYILPTGKTGAQWGAMTAGNIALYEGGGWIEITTRPGMIAVVGGTGVVRRTASGWIAWSLTMAPTKNYALNPRFELWSDGASQTGISTTRRFGPEGYFGRRNSGAGGANWELTRQAGFLGARYCMRMGRAAGDTSTTSNWVAAILSAEDAAAIAGKTILIHADARKGADFSPSGSLLDANVHCGTGVEETMTSSTGFATGAVNTALTGQLLTTTAARIIWPEYAVPSNTTEFAYRFALNPANATAAGAADYAELTNLMLEVVDPATPRASPFECLPRGLEELRLRRNYEKIAIRTENGSRPVRCLPKRATPAISTTVGSVANAQVDSCELSHSSAADAVVTFDARI